MKYVCKNCGCEFNGKPSARRVYCSKKCHDEAQTTGRETKCDVCGKEIRIHPSDEKWDKHFCCNEHRLIWLSSHVKTELNIAGHSKGHRAPHLTKLNEERNPLLALEPDAAKRGTYAAKQHRKVMERIIGRKLKPNEDVHHINGVHDDNRPENLVVMTHSEHLKLHWKILKESGVMPN